MKLVRGQVLKVRKIPKDHLLDRVSKQTLDIN